MDNSIQDMITNKIYWESNNLVRHNPNIAPEQIIHKTSTKSFPFNAVTVRINNQRKGFVTVYFRDAKKTKTYGSGKNKQTFAPALNDCGQREINVYRQINNAPTKCFPSC